MIRNKKLLRGIAVFLLINFGQTIFSPAVSLALTSGPAQPEFTAYEEIDNTDMVNLVTGDFTYNMPILEVPGPEGSFSLPLSYHAGIRPEQEASWVGLGWSLNPGAINRSINQFPDDFAGQTIHTDIYDPGGYGYSINFIVGNYSYDSEKGEGGTIGLASYLMIGYGNQSDDFSVLGINGKAENFGQWAAQIGGAVITVAGMGAPGALAQSAVGVGIGAGMQAMGEVSSGNYTESYSNGFKVESKNYFFYKKWRYWLDYTRDDAMYGTLYLGELPIRDAQENVSKSTPLLPDNTCATNTDRYDACSDMHITVDNSELALNINPTSIAMDGYSILGQGVSGAIKPYRYDMGSLAYPSYVDIQFRKLKLIPFLTSSAYKVKFHYNGDYSNQYDYHLYPNSNNLGFTYDYCSGGTKLKWNVQDPGLYDPNKRVEPARYGFQNNKLIQGRNVEWYTNNEIMDNTSNGAIAKGFIDFQSSTDRATFRNSLPALVKSNGIGGYSVTRPDGTTFHYALPAYNTTQVTSSNKVGDVAKYKNSINNNWYAYEWLLTAITGPDFVDRGEIGVLDENDWGYWVKLDYGKFASNYSWMSPYWGKNVISDAPDYEIYSGGVKETYYLNTITTRTHTALFIKDVRNDARGFYNINLTNSLPSSSLKLDEIVVLKNEDFATLNLAKNSNNNTGLANNDTYANVYDKYDVTPTKRTYIKEHQLKRVKFVYDRYSTLGNGVSITDSNGDADDYDLCQGTINSFPDALNPPMNGSDPYGGRTGKLTLHGVSVMGRNDEKLLPDYQFDYNAFNIYGTANLTENPNYNLNKWDGWGMYKSDGQNTNYGHHTLDGNVNDGKVWSLRRIITPMGGTLEVDYERDSYASVSGVPIPGEISVFSMNTNNLNSGITYVSDGTNLANFLTPGMVVSVTGIGNLQFGQIVTIQQNFTIASVSSTSVRFVEDIDHYSQGENWIPGSLILTLNFTRPKLYGGDIRVSQLRTSSDGIYFYKTNYFYTNDGTPTGMTSGVVAQEPEYIKLKDLSFGNYYDYPVTPVLYNKVTVYNGRLSSLNDYTSKSEYVFTVPNPNMITQSITAQVDEDFPGESDYKNRMRNYIINVNTSQIGRLESIKVSDKNNTILSSSVMNYIDNTNAGDLGAFTEGSILSEARAYKPDPDVAHYNTYYRLFRTTKTYHPNILASVTNVSGKTTTTVKNTLWDFYTGEVLEKSFSNSLGTKYYSVSSPAYEHYPTMGPKALNPANKNMLTQKAGEYLYKDTPNGWAHQTTTISTVSTSGSESIYNVNLGSFVLPPTYRAGYWCGLDVTAGTSSTYITPQIISITKDRKSFRFKWGTGLTNPSSLGYIPRKLVNVGIQTWDSTWNSLEYDGVNAVFVNQAITNSNEKIWRKKAVYAWRSSELNTDGTFKNYIDFDWSGTALDSKWLKLSETVNYDRYSKPLESKDVNGNFSTMKMGYNNTYPLFSVANANYAEAAYSGAEDLGGPFNAYFGSEVSKWSGTLTSSYAHTGKYGLSVGTEQTGFYYKVKIEPVTGIIVDKKYKASVWIYNNGNTDAGLYYGFEDLSAVSLGNMPIVTVLSSNPVITAGNWKLITMEFSVPATYANKFLIVGCKNPYGTVAYFDDFRFHPLNTTFVSNVYDSQTGLITHKLDGDNFYVRYEYDAKDRLKAVYKETIKGEIKKEEYYYNTGRSGD